MSERSRSIGSPDCAARRRAAFSGHASICSPWPDALTRSRSLKHLWRVPHAARHASSLSLARPAWVKANSRRFLEICRAATSEFWRRCACALRRGDASQADARPPEGFFPHPADLRSAVAQANGHDAVLQRLLSEPEDEAMILELLGLTQGSESNKPDPSVRRARLIKFFCQLFNSDGKRILNVSCRGFVYSNRPAWTSGCAVPCCSSGTSKTDLRMFRLCALESADLIHGLNLEKSIRGNGCAVVYSGEDDALAEWGRPICKSDGNPVFLEELTWAVAPWAEGTARRLSGHLFTQSRVAGADGARRFVLPASMHWIPFRKLLQIAAVILEKPSRCSGRWPEFGGGAAHGPADASARRAHLRAAAGFNRMRFRHSVIFCRARSYTTC